jgi:hypothetical protein
MWWRAKRLKKGFVIFLAIFMLLLGLLAVWVWRVGKEF